MAIQIKYDSKHGQDSNQDVVDNSNGIHSKGVETITKNDNSTSNKNVRNGSSISSNDDRKCGQR